MKIFSAIAIIIFLLLSGGKTFVDTSAIKIPAIKIESTDQNISFKNGYWFYDQKLFSGIIVERYSNKKIHHITGFVNGKEEGEQQSFFPDGKILEKRFYHKGEKNGTEIGWWENSNKRFEYHFTNGIYNGDYKEWYEDGKPLRWIHYTNGKDDWGKGWRETGKLFMNYEMKNGRRYGIVNSNLCYTIKNGKGEYVVSSANN